MPQMRTNHRKPIYTSRCGELKLRGTAAQIAAKYADLAEASLKEKDDMQARIYSQHAEHWRKVEQ